MPWLAMVATASTPTAAVVILNPRFFMFPSPRVWNIRGVCLPRLPCSTGFGRRTLQRTTCFIWSLQVPCPGRAKTLARTLVSDFEGSPWGGVLGSSWGSCLDPPKLDDSTRRLVTETLAHGQR